MSVDALASVYATVLYSKSR